MSKIFSVDAETDGLYGQVWAIGAVVLKINEDRSEGCAVFGGMIDPLEVGDPWVRENIVPVVHHPRYEDHGELLEAFWSFWLQHRGDSICVSDFGAPVEAGLFRACIERDLENRMWLGPYPMHELGTALLLAGLDPDANRRELAGKPDLVQHDPVDDAIAAAYCWKRIASGP
jgi:hypothetical protein